MSWSLSRRLAAACTGAGDSAASQSCTALALWHRAATRGLAHEDSDCAGTRLNLLRSVWVYLKEEFKKLMMVVVKLVVRRKRCHRGEAETWRNKLSQSLSESTGMASRFGTVVPVRRGEATWSYPSCPYSNSYNIRICKTRREYTQRHVQNPQWPLSPILFSIT